MALRPQENHPTSAVAEYLVIKSEIKLLEINSKSNLGCLIFALLILYSYYNYYAGTAISKTDYQNAFNLALYSAPQKKKKKNNWE